MAEDSGPGARTCIWRSCDLKGVPTDDVSCPKCGVPTEPRKGVSTAVLTYDPSRRPLIVTTNEVPLHRVTAVYGDVFGCVVVSRDYFTSIRAQFRAMGGGEVNEFTDLLVSSRNEARSRLWEEASSLGANAVVAFRFDCAEIAGVMTEVAAYGTAVTVEPLTPGR